MSKRLNQLIFLEKRILADREEMLQLMEETQMSDDSDSKMVEYKLHCFQKELEYLSGQAEILKAEEYNRKTCGISSGRRKL